MRKEGVNLGSDGGGGVGFGSGTFPGLLCAVGRDGEVVQMNVNELHLGFAGFAVIAAQSPHLGISADSVRCIACRRREQYTFWCSTGNEMSLSPRHH